MGSKLLKFEYKQKIHEILYRRKNITIIMRAEGDSTLTVRIGLQNIDRNTPRILFTDGVRQVRVYNRPELYKNGLIVQGKDKRADSETTSFTFATPEEMKQMMLFLADAEAHINGHQLYRKHPTGQFRLGDCFYYKNGMIQITEDDEELILKEVIRGKKVEVRNEQLHQLRLTKTGFPVPWDFHYFFEYAGNTNELNKAA